MRAAHYVHEDITDDVDAPLAVEGTVPSEVRGTLLAIGGTGTAVGPHRLHGFDAHGRVTAVHIGDSGATLRARMVQTPLLLEERAARTLLRRRVFTNKPGRWANLFDVNLGNNAWHNVVPWGDALVALNDPGFFLLDPATLATRGPFPLAPAKGATFLPMPRRDPASGSMVLVEVRGGRKDTLVVRLVDDALGVRDEQTYRLPRGAGLYHDVAFTPAWYVVAQWNALSVPRALWGKATISRSLDFDPATTPTIHLLPRAGGPAVSVPLPGGRQHFHFWNAQERDGRVLLDTPGYTEPVGFSALYPVAARAAVGAELEPTRPAGSWRYAIDPVARTVDASPLTTEPADAPEIRPDRRGAAVRYGYAPAPGSSGDDEDPLGYFWAHALARHDLEERTVVRWDAGPHRYVSPAAFVARGDDEADGWLLAFVQEPARRRSSVVVLDAADLPRGPVATLSADGLLGMVSHVSFRGALA